MNYREEKIKSQLEKERKKLETLEEINTKLSMVSSEVKRTQEYKVLKATIEARILRTERIITLLELGLTKREAEEIIKRPTVNYIKKELRKEHRKEEREEERKNIRKERR